MNQKIIAWLLIFLILVPSPLLALGVRRDDTNRFTYGFMRLLMAPFQIPYQAFDGTVRGPLVMGTVGGVFRGAFYTVSDLVGGVFDMVAAAAPYAKYAVFFV